MNGRMRVGGKAAGEANPWLMAFVVVVVVVGCYWPALQGSLVWDDQAHVTRAELRSWAGLGRIWWDIHATQQYYPVLHSAFWVEQQLWGDEVLGYHLVNVGLHSAACLLLARVLRRLWAVRPPASATVSPSLPANAEWLAALIFAVHPVGVESVAWISEQKNTLSLVFYLLAALGYLNFVSKRSPSAYVWATLFFLLALGTKSVTATLPAALLVMLWWRMGKLSWWKEVLPLLPWFALSLVAGLFTAWIERKLIGAEGVAFDLTLGERMLLAGRVVWFYLGKLGWPVDLMFVYPHWDVAKVSSDWSLAVAGVTVGLWSVRQRWRGPLAAWLFFVGSLFPVLGFFNVYPFIFSYVADHFQYLPMIGVIAGVAVSVALFLSKVPAGMRAGGWVVCGGVLVAFAVQSNRQSRIYTDSETLYRHTIALNPGCWMALNNLGLELARSPQTSPEAIACYEQAIRLRPDYAEAHNNFGVELAKIDGRTTEAIAHYEQALRKQPDYAEAHNNLASALAALPGRELDAVAHYEYALRLKPNYPEVHYNLANTLVNLPGRLPAALEHYQQALQLNPRYALAHYNLANALAGIPGRQREAMAHYESALQIRPDFADAHVALGNLLANTPGGLPDALKHYEMALRLAPGVAGVHYNLANVWAKLPDGVADAVKHYEEALRINADFVEAHYALAMLLEKLPDRQEDAVTHFEAVLRLRPDDVAAHNNLAIVYARLGRLQQARDQWNKALELAPGYDDPRKNLQLLDRMQAR